MACCDEIVTFGFPGDEYAVPLCKNCLRDAIKVVKELSAEERVARHRHVEECRGLGAFRLSEDDLTEEMEDKLADHLIFYFVYELLYGSDAQEMVIEGDLNDVKDDLS